MGGVHDAAARRLGGHVQVLFDYCPERCLDPDYRTHLILRELQAYSADIMCLQVRACLQSAPRGWLTGRARATRRDREESMPRFARERERQGDAAADRVHAHARSPALLLPQEVDARLFNDVLVPHLARAGYEGHFTNKQGKVREGSATFWRRARFARLLSADIKLRDVFKQVRVCARLRTRHPLATAGIHQM